MKTKLILIVLMSLAINVTAQITLEHTYTTDQPNQRIIKLSLSGVKYVSLHYSGASADYFKLYNINHSVFKTIQIPQVAGWNANEIGNISETLFALDSLIEYLVLYRDPSGMQYKTYIYNESGTTILYEPNGVWSYGITSLPPAVISTGDSTKLILGISAGGLNFTSTKVYSLPGQLTCFECNNGIVSGMILPYDNQINKEYSLPYPNPSSGSVKIKYKLPENYHKAFIDIFDMKGQLIKQMEIDNAYEEITLSNQDFPSGEYFYSIIVDNKILERNKYIIIK